MSIKFNSLKQNFLEREGLLYDKEFLSEDDNERISIEYLNGDEQLKDKILEMYDFDYEEKNCKYHFYKLVPSDITEKETTLYISLQILENLKAANEKLDTVKFIMVFWFILSLIGVLFSILSLVGLR